MSLKTKGILYTILAWLLVAVLVGLLLFALSPLLEVGHSLLGHAIPPIEHTDITEYTSGEFAERRGGADAKEALPSIEELGNYEKIGYCYINHTVKRIACLGLPDIWIVDVQYAEEDFKEAAYKAYCRYAEGTDEEKYKTFWENYSMGFVVARKQYDEDNCSSVELFVEDVDSCVIRYMYTSHGNDYGDFMWLRHWGAYPEIGSLWEDTEG